MEIAYFMTVQNPKKDIPLQQRVQICKRNYHSKAYYSEFWPVIDLLKSNTISCSQLKNDTIIEVESYKIADYKLQILHNEGHYLQKCSNF
jgi:hypothetical protein